MDSFKVVVDRIPDSFQENEAREYFEHFGEVEKVEMERGKAHVWLGDKRTFDAVLEMYRHHEYGEPKQWIRVTRDGRSPTPGPDTPPRKLKKKKRKEKENRPPRNTSGNIKAVDRLGMGILGGANTQYSDQPPPFVPLQHAHYKKSYNESDNRKGMSVNDPCKIFLGGLRRSITPQDIESYFSDYGTVKNVDIKLDADGIPRGFGFVTFRHPESVQRVLQQYMDHVIFGKWVEVRPAQASGWVAPGQTNKGRGKGEDPRRIFVGNIPLECMEADVEAYFRRFGQLNVLPMKMDLKGDQRHRFAIVVFENTHDARAVLRSGPHTLMNKKVDVRVAHSAVKKRLERWLQLEQAGNYGPPEGYGPDVSPCYKDRYCPY